MTAELRRSFKLRAKQAFDLPSRLRKGIIEKLDGESIPENTPHRSNSFDLGYFIPLSLSGFDSIRDSGVGIRNSAGQSQILRIRLRQVSATDTLPGLAAQFETTTSELKKLNRLMSDMVFPGQTIYIPDKDYIPSESSTPPNSPSPLKDDDLEKEKSEKSPKETGSTSDGQSYTDLLLMGIRPILSVGKQPTTEGEVKHVEEWTEQFIKLNVKHIIDGQADNAIAGLLLVTPNAVMFDPDLTDGRVVQGGQESYSVIVPMQAITSILISHELPADKHSSRFPSILDSNDFSIRDHAEEDVFLTQDEQDQLCQKSGNCQERGEEGTLREDGVEGTLRDGGAEATSRDGGAEGTSRNVGAEGTSQDGGAEGTSRDGGAEKKSQDGGAEGTSRDGGAEKKSQDVGAEGTSRDDSAEKKLRDGGAEGTSRDVGAEGTSGDGGAEKKSQDGGAEETELNGDVAPSDEVSKVKTKEEDIIANNEDKHVSPERKSNEETSAEQQRIEVKSHGSSTSSDVATDLCDVVAPSGLEQEKSRCSALVGNILRYPTSRMIDKEKENQSDSGSPAECSTPTHKIMSRTLESISSYSSSFVDFSNSLFSRSAPEGKSSQSSDKCDNANSSSPKCETSSDKEGNQEQEETAPTAKSQRIFFLRPLDMLTKKKKATTSSQSGGNIDGIEDHSGSTEDGPLYLCLKTRKFFEWSSFQSCPIASYIRNQLQSEYWFTVPPDKVDLLYAFFVQWSPNVMGLSDEINLQERGFIVIGSTDGSAGSDETGRLNNQGCMSRQTGCGGREWEIVNAKEVQRMITVAEIESLPLPELSEPSNIVEKIHIRELCFHLPARAEGCPWNLIYNSEKHGFSLRTLYRRMEKIDCPILLLIKDDTEQIFGAMLPCALKMSEAFYGNGESYLFSFYNGFKKFPWTGQNNYFIKGSGESICVGAGEGAYGLWLDGDLYHGRTQSCLTYGNDILTGSEDFVVRYLEVWSFV